MRRTGGLRAGEGANSRSPEERMRGGVRVEAVGRGCARGTRLPKLAVRAAWRVWGGQCRCCKSQPEPAVTSPISPDVFPRRLAELNIPQWALWGVSSLTSTRF